MFQNFGGRREGEAFSFGFGRVSLSHTASGFGSPEAGTADKLTRSWRKTKQHWHRAREVCVKEGSGVLVPL